ncbi:MAG: bifunctional phosphoribosylaminoimidazolecarboxamide formyltransferase/IMP cyclohydrolase [bacterium]|nr:bifunctional phosphoribosylaminoimidazolecarboxamide formyltransferase/IMP cyclohydrolase [bacterium]
MIKVTRALISISDKRGIISLVNLLSDRGVEIISTGGTASIIKDAGIPVKLVSELTGFPEILEGRVKTLHPKIHGGILAKREDKHLNQLDIHDILPIDLVVVSLYPFADTIQNTNDLEKIIENIDIGGVALLRAAAKNFRYVVTLTSPHDYERLIKTLDENQGKIPQEMSFELATKAFMHTANYDAIISRYLYQQVSIDNKNVFPEILNLSYQKVADLRYGENPHQKAAFYKEIPKNEPNVTNAEKLHGKELSFNNILDLDAALEITKEYNEIIAVIIKHTNPCGIATGNTLAQAYRKAYQVDPVSAFGSVLGFNRMVDEETAGEITKTFVEAVIAPDYSKEALDVLQEKKNIRLLKCSSLDKFSYCREDYDLRKIVGGGVLVQERNMEKVKVSNLNIVSKKTPSEDELESLIFGWKAIKHIKSNTILISTKDRIIGYGIGQTSRILAMKIALDQAGEEAKGAAVISDAFFPFRDSVDEANKAGIIAIIQPGGSVRDQDVIEAVNEYGMSMAFTGIRCFKH